MENDEKLKSREEEQRAAGHEEQSSSKTSAEGDAAPPSDAPDTHRLEPDFGMPAFDFPNESKTDKADTRADDTRTSAKGAADLPLEEGTGWENGSSIEREGSLRERMSLQESQNFYDSGDDTPAFGSMSLNEGASRSEATVMPFPGTTLGRPPEPTPVNLLPEGDDGEFSEYGGGILPDAPAYEAEEQENLADAVQSALRNVYGARSGDAWDDDESGDFTLADSLKTSDNRSDAIWAQVQERSNEAYLEDEQEEAAAEANTEAVLDYLYGRRRNDLDETETLTLDTALKDFEPAPGYEPDWRDRDDTDDRAAQFPGGQREPEPAYHGHSGGEAAMHGDGPPVFGNADSARWEQPGYSANLPARAGQTYASAPQEQLSGGSDSGHLLGAAGLGLIGGIALAGVLAVFVFNSFVDVNETAGTGADKVVGRLASTAGGDRIPLRQARSAPDAAQPSAGQEGLVVRPVTGFSNEAIRLDIALDDPALAEDALVSIKGLPKGAKLSTGIDVSGGQWLLPPARLRNLTVSVPAATIGTFNMVAQLLKDDAQTSLSNPVPFTLTVTSKVASQQPAAATTAQGEDQAQIETDFLTQMLVRDGNKQMREGDIIAARRLYEQAAMSGSPAAALAMGRSYDPTYFEKLTIKTGKPDPAAAFEWYKKALDGGLSTARIKIDALKQWLQK